MRNLFIVSAFVLLLLGKVGCLNVELRLWRWVNAGMGLFCWFCDGVTIEKISYVCDESVDDFEF